jgi:hypothetical protein
VLVLAGAFAFATDRDQTRRALVASAGGAAILGLGELAMLAGPAVLRTDTSQDAFLRRAGLADSLAHAYRDRLIHRWTRYVQWASIPLAVVGAWRPRGWIRRALWAWAIVTVIGVAIGAATGWFPPDRFITFGYAIPILAAFGLLVLVERWRTRRAAALAVCAVLTLAMIAGAGIAWLREKPYLGTQAVDDVTLAARYASASPRGTPWIFPVDSPSPTISFLATRLGNVIRAAVPPDRIADVYVVVPPPPPGLDEAHRREWSALARLYASDAAAAASRSSSPPVVIDVDAFRARGGNRTPVCSGRVCAAVAAPRTSVGDGVSISTVVVPVATRGAPPRDTALDSSTAAAVLAVPLVFLVLSIAGLGWALAAVRHRALAAALAPAFGTAALILVGVAADRLGLRLSSAEAGLGVLAFASAGGYGALLLERRRRPDAPP